MASISIRRTVDPYQVTGSFEFTAQDLEAAFRVADPDEQLFFELFSPGLNEAGLREKFAVLERLAALMDRATALELRAGAPVLK